MTFCAKVVDVVSILQNGKTANGFLTSDFVNIFQNGAMYNIWGRATALNRLAKR
jgi:hypothetical protein